jgi:PAS domain S-box-containing protein
MTRWLPIATLRVRLILLVLLAIIPALAIMLYTAAESRRREAVLAQEEALTLTELIASREEESIESARQLLIALAQLPVVRQGDAAACNTLFADLIEEYPDYNTLGLVNAEGEVVCRSIPLTLPQNVGDRSWFQRATQSHDFAIGDYQLSQATGTPTVILAYPILSPAGQVQSVVAVGLKLGLLGRFTDRIRLPEGAAVIKIDRNGTILDSHPQPEQWIGQTLPEAPLIRTILTQKQGIAEVSGVDGVTRLYAFTPLHSTVETGLSLAVGIPTQVIFASIDQMWTRNLAGLALAALLAGAAAWVGGNVFVLRRVETLLNTSERLRVGDLSARTGPPYGAGEFGQLARVFDQMAAALQQRETERQLESEVLRESEQRFRLMADTAPVLIWMAGPDKRRNYFNQVWLDFTGRDTIQEHDYGWAEGVHPDDFQGCLDTYNSAFDARQSFEMEYRLRTAAGQYRWIVEVAVPRFEGDRFAGHIGSAIDIHERKETEHRLHIQYAVAQVLAESNSLAEASEKILQSVCGGVGGTFGALYRVDRNDKLLHHESMWHPVGEQFSEFEQATCDRTLASGKGLAGRVWASGQSTWIPEVADDSDLARRAIAAKAGLHTALAFPIGSRDAIMAVIECFGQSMDEPQADMLAMLEAIGNQIGNFMERVQAEEALQVRARQQAAVANFGQLALTKLEVSTLQEEAAELVTHILAVPYCEILELRPDGQTLELCAGVGWPEGVVGQATVEAGSETYAGYTLSTDLPTIVEDLADEKRFKDSGLIHGEKVVSGISVIIHRREQPFGLLRVHTVARRVFIKDDVNFLEAVANILAAAVEHQQAEEALRLSRDQLAIILEGVADSISAIDPAGHVIYANEAAARLSDYPSVSALPEIPLAEVGQKFEILDELGHSLSLVQLPSRLALQGEPNPTAIIRFREITTGVERWLNVKSKPVFDEHGEVALAVNVVQDITELKRAELSQRVLAEAGKLLAASPNYEKRLQALAQSLVPTLGDWCAINIVEADQSIRLAAAAHADPAKTALIYELARRWPVAPNDSSGTPAALRSGRPEYYPDVSDSLLASLSRSPEHLQGLRELGYKSVIIMPLRVDDHSIGGLTLVVAESGRRYDAATLGLVEELARRATLALENARLYDEAQRLNAELEKRVLLRTAALQTMNTQLKDEIIERKRTQAELAEVQRRLMESREAERVHLAQELHDGPVQELYGASFRLGALKEALLDETKLNDLAATQITIQQVIQTLRAMFSELRPPALAPFGLEKAIRSHAERFQTEHPELEVTLELMPDGQALPEPVRLALFRIYQEALNNVLRHAEANAVWIRFTLETAQAILEVQDNGHGFKVPQRWLELARQGHLGLVGISERTEAIGGELKIISTPGAGTTIRVVVSRPEAGK